AAGEGDVVEAQRLRAAAAEVDVDAREAAALLAAERHAARVHLDAGALLVGRQLHGLAGAAADRIVGEDEELPLGRSRRVRQERRLAGARLAGRDGDGLLEVDASEGLRSEEIEARALHAEAPVAGDPEA